MRSGLRALALVLLSIVAVVQGCHGKRGADDERTLQWTFDGARVVSVPDSVPLTGPLINERWAAVVDAESRKIAWLQVPLNDGPRLTEVEPGRLWVADGYVLGPGEDFSEVLRDNKLLKYTWEVERTGDKTLSVNFSAKVLQHVVIASFSNFELRLPLSGHAGARAEVDGSFGGTIRRNLPPGPLHPSYWEGPLSSLTIGGPRVQVDVDFTAGGFSWVSLLDARALPRPDTALVVEMYPAIAGPHELLGSLAMKDNVYESSYTLTLSFPPSPTDPPVSTAKAEAIDAPAALPAAAKSRLAGAMWEMEPFIASDRDPAPDGPAFSVHPRRCEIRIPSGRSLWSLDAGDEGKPRPAYIAATGPVEGLRLTINGAGDGLDGEGAVDQLDLELLAPSARAEAVWRYAAGTTYQMPVYPTTDLGEFLSSYGYGLSSTLSTMALVKLWGHAGLPSRRVFIDGEIGSAFAEVYYEGDWRLYDLAGRTFYADPADNSVPSAADLVNSPALVAANCDAGGEGPGGAPAAETAGLRFEGASISYNPGNISFERSMCVNLSRGETLIRLFRPLGVHAPSPRTPYNYANSLLVFEPDLDDDGALEGFKSATNCEISDGKIVPEDRTSPVSLEYRARSPYVIVQSILEVEAEPGTLERIAVMVSKDEGLTWIPVPLDSSSGVADLTPQLVPGPQPAGTAYENLERNFSFLLHLEVSPGRSELDGSIGALSVVTAGQINPAGLPRLSSGTNTLETYCATSGEGAYVDIGWIEGVPGASAAFVGEEFSLTGAVVNRGDSRAPCRVAGYSASGGERVDLGSWSTAEAVGPGREVPFELSCSAAGLASIENQLQSGAYEIMLEIEGAAPRWDSRLPVRVMPLNRPDLVVRPELVTFSPSRPRPGTEVVVTAIVRNHCRTGNLLYLQGAPSGPFEVTLYEAAGDSRSPVEAVSLPGLSPCSFAPVTFKWTPPSTPGPISLQIVADSGDSVRERDERNTAAVDVVVVP